MNGNAMVAPSVGAMMSQVELMRVLCNDDLHCRSTETRQVLAFGGISPKI